MDAERTKKKIALASAVLMGGMGIYYCWQTIAGEIQPVLATWIIFVVATCLSLWTYLSHHKHSLVDNILNIVDAFTVVAVLLTILIFGQNVRLGFNTFEIGCLAACAVILVVWRLTRKHALSNLALQAVITVAYFPTLYQLATASENTESFVVWSIWFVGCFLALVTAWLGKNKLAIAYALRATLLVAVIIGLMVRLELH